MADLSYYDLTYEGPVLQEILDTAQDMRQNGYIFKGVLSPGEVSEDTEEPSFWLATAGTYTGDVSVTIASGYLGVLAKKNDIWAVASLQIGSGGGGGGGDDKADKVTGATAGHLAGLNGSGNLTDSGYAIAVVTQAQYDVSAKSSDTIYCVTS